ncbi:hypothetical protein T265_12859, partial [Opisthorchis viverrini]
MNRNWVKNQQMQRNPAKLKIVQNWGKRGGCFGEVALLDKESLRTATVIADCETELIVVDRALYNRSLKEVHQVELREKAEFVNRCPTFEGWPYALLKQVGLSLRKVTMSYGAPVVRQGEPLNKMFFLLSATKEREFTCRVHTVIQRLGARADLLSSNILRWLNGQVQVSVDILMHQKQFPEMMPKPKPLSTGALLSTDNSTLDIEYQLNPLELLLAPLDADQTVNALSIFSASQPCVKPRQCESALIKVRQRLRNMQRIAASLSQKERAKQKLVQKPLSRLGYRFGERLRGLRHIDLAIYSGGEIFGELEYGFGMKTYCCTATCIEPCEFFVLHKNNITRLMNSRRNINSWKKLAALAERNLVNHFEQIQLHRVPLFQSLYDKYLDKKRQMAKWLECEFAEQKVRGSNPTSGSRLPLSGLELIGSTLALELLSGGMDRKDATSEQVEALNSSKTVYPSRRRRFVIPLATRLRRAHLTSCVIQQDCKICTKLFGLPQLHRTWIPRINIRGNTRSGNTSHRFERGEVTNSRKPRPSTLLCRLSLQAATSSSLVFTHAPWTRIGRLRSGTILLNAESLATLRSARAIVTLVRISGYRNTSLRQAYLHCAGWTVHVGDVVGTISAGQLVNRDHVSTNNFIFVNSMVGYQAIFLIATLATFLTREPNESVLCTGWNWCRGARRFVAEEEQRERAAQAKKDVKSVSSYEEFIPSRGAVIDQYGPGTVFYRNQQRRAAAERAEKIK